MPTNKRFTDDSYRKEPWFRALCSAFQVCKNEEDLSEFLGDIATLGELQALCERLEVAKQLANGLSYRQVSKITGASTTTVTRVAKSIENGTGGYRKVLRIHRHHRKTAAVKRIRDFAKEPDLPPPLKTEQVVPPPVDQPATGDMLLQKYLTRQVPNPESDSRSTGVQH